MDAEDQGLSAFLKCFGCCNICLDHEFLDQAVRIEAIRDDHPVNLAVRRQEDLAFGQVKVQRLAPVTSALEDCIGLPQRLEHGFQNRPGLVVRLAIDGGLRLWIGNFRGALHHDAMEPVCRLAAFPVKRHAHRKGRAVLAFPQRTQIIGDTLRQHRYDAVREIAGIAAPEGLPVKGRTGADIPGDIGNRDRDDHAALIVRRSVGFGIDGVVMVLGVGWVDGDKRQGPPVFPR